MLLSCIILERTKLKISNRSWRSSRSCHGDAGMKSRKLEGECKVSLVGTINFKFRGSFSLTGVGRREWVEPEVKFEKCWTMMNEVDISFV